MSPRRNDPDPWPWPADSTLDRARRVARSYRDALAKRDPRLCRRLDEQMSGLGQGWVQPKPWVYDDDEQLSVHQVADMCDVKPRTVDRWRAMGLRALTTPDGLRFRVGDVLEFHARRRRERAESRGRGETGV